MVGCLAIASVAFDNCGVLRLQEVYLLGGCDPGGNRGGWEGKLVCSKSFCIFILNIICIKTHSD